MSGLGDQDAHQALQDARDEFAAALAACERQAEHAKDAVYQEKLDQAHIHFEAGKQAIERAIQAKRRLNAAFSKLTDAVPYA